MKRYRYKNVFTDPMAAIEEAIFLANSNRLTHSVVQFESWKLAVVRGNADRPSYTARPSKL